MGTTRERRSQDGWEGLWEEGSSGTQRRDTELLVQDWTEMWSSCTTDFKEEAEVESDLACSLHPHVSHKVRGNAMVVLGQSFLFREKLRSISNFSWIGTCASVLLTVV